MAYDIFKSRDRLHPIFNEKVTVFFNKYSETYIKKLNMMTNKTIKYYHGTVIINKENLIQKIESA